jgi:precorrin-6B methylase 2
MLELAQPKRGEVLYDLGSGDGRVLIEVAKEYGVRAIGIEINPILVLISKRKVKKAGLEKTVKIHWGNFFNQNLSDANIIVVYLSKSANRKLEEKFLRELKPGARIVSEAFTFDKIPLVKVHPKYQDLKLYQI